MHSDLFYLSFKFHSKNKEIEANAMLYKSCPFKQTKTIEKKIMKIFFADLISNSV
jgi:hypothetical protein